MDKNGEGDRRGMIDDWEGEEQKKRRGEEKRREEEEYSI